MVAVRTERAELCSYYCRCLVLAASGRKQETSHLHESGHQGNLDLSLSDAKVPRDTLAIIRLLYVCIRGLGALAGHRAARRFCWVDRLWIDDGIDRRWRRAVRGLSA